MSRPLHLASALLLALACARASAEERPAFDLRVPNPLASGKTEHRLLLMNNTGKELSLKLDVTPLRSEDPAKQVTYQVMLRGAGKTALDLAYPVKLAPGEYHASPRS
ncbi:MAG TPA: hypothetical protein VE057_18845 [Archangium sp.]|nr:hypothetical protein [Archangium sp.]